MSDVMFAGRFAELARFYSTGRPTYPRLLAQRVTDLIGLKRSHTVLDLGTGPGFLALDFHPYAARVIGVDPEVEMLRFAREAAHRAGMDIEFVQGSAAELGSALGRPYLVTIGRAFHWMDRKKILTLLENKIEPGGAVVLFEVSYPVVPVNDWHSSFQATLDYYGAEDPARERTQKHKDHEAVLLASTFNHLERVSVLEPRYTSVQRIVDHALSFARAWQGRPGSRLDDMAVEVRESLEAYAENDMVAEVVEGTALIARRPAEVVA